MIGRYHGSYEPIDGFTDQQNQQLEMLFELAAKGELIGIFDKIDNDVYHAGPGVSSSGLQMLRESPFAMQKNYFPFRYQERESAAERNLTIGSAIHCKLFEPEKFSDIYYTSSERMRNTAAYKEDVRSFPQHIVLSKKEGDMIDEMLLNVQLLEDYKLMLDPNGVSEKAFWSVHPQTGILIKCKADRIANQYIWDAKSCQDSSLKKFNRNAEDCLMYLSAALYIDVVNDVFKNVIPYFPGIRGFRIIAMEKQSSPFVSQIYQFDDHSIELGREHYNSLLNVYSECLEKNEWPFESKKYSTKTQLLTMSEWTEGKFNGN